jgi:hypothetical protein
MDAAKKGENSEKWHQSFGGGLWLNGLNVSQPESLILKF